VQDHRFEFEVEGTPDEVWDVFWGRMRTGIQTDTVKIEIYHPGDENGNGLVRHCDFQVPKYLLSGGKAQSWEWITESERPVSWRYDAVGKPLWSRASGWTGLEDLGGGRTRVSFRETYEAFNPVMRVLLEKRVHHFISKGNDKLIEASVVRSLRKMRERRAASPDGASPDGGSPAGGSPDGGSPDGGSGSAAVTPGGRAGPTPS
jgi:hypothetical protein